MGRAAGRTLDTKALIASVNREDVWREAAAKMAGVAQDDMPAGPSRGEGSGSSTASVRSTPPSRPTTSPVSSIKKLTA